MVPVSRTGLFPENSWYNRGFKMKDKLHPVPYHYIWK